MQEPKYTMTITLMADGTVDVNGPIDNQFICYGLLECARDAIKTYNERKLNGQRIAMPSPELVGALAKN